MTWLTLFFALELGWMPNGDFLMFAPSPVISVTNSFYTELEVRVTIFNFIFVGGDIKTFVWAVENAFDFVPERSLYSFEVGLTHGPIELGFRDYCTHPIWVYLWMYKLVDATYGQAVSWEGGYKEVYLRLRVGDK